MNLSEFFTQFYFVIASVTVYFLITCFTDSKYCKNPEDIFILPTRGFIAPFSMLQQYRYKIFLQSFFSPRNPYIFIIIGLIVGYALIKFRRYRRSLNEKKNNQENSKEVTNDIVTNEEL